MIFYFGLVVVADSHAEPQRHREDGFCGFLLRMGYEEQVVQNDGEGCRMMQGYLCGLEALREIFGFFALKFSR
jgi:hypothetical protein